MKNNFGMWIFLTTEFLIFGTLIFIYQLFFYQYRESFESAGQEMHVFWGTINTVVLLTSSALVALSHVFKKRSLLLGAAFLGLIFLSIKGHEYYELTISGRFPLNFQNILQNEKLFYSFYAYLTIIHALHVFIGVGALLYLFWVYPKPHDQGLEEGVGLYWHFVDLVWVFLYPMFYLIGNHL